MLDGMTNVKASEVLKELKNYTEDLPPYSPDEVAEALEMAIKALEKDIAKEPAQTHKRYGHGNEYDDYFCPVCDGFLAYEPQGDRYKGEGGWSRCRNCGQKIKWEGESE